MKASLLRWKATAKNSTVSSALPSTVDAAGASHHERLLWRMDAAARYAHILAVTRAAQEGRSGSELHLSRGLRVTIGRDALRFTYPRGQGPWRGRLGPV